MVLILITLILIFSNPLGYNDWGYVIYGIPIVVFWTNKIASKKFKKECKECG